MKKLITEPEWALAWIKNIEPDPDMLEICKKDKKVYQALLGFILQRTKR